MKWVAYLLIMLFSFQALPVKELRKVLKKAATEQVQDDSDSTPDAEKQCPEKDLEKLFVHTLAFHLTPLFTEKQVKTALRYLPFFEGHFYPDVATPPPDAPAS